MFLGASEKAVLTIYAWEVRLTWSSTASQATRGAGDCHCATEWHLGKKQGWMQMSASCKPSIPLSDQSWVSHFTPSEWPKILYRPVSIKIPGLTYEGLQTSVQPNVTNASKSSKPSTT